MSGGAFNYAYYSIREKLDEIATGPLPEMLEWMKSHSVNPEAIRLVQDFLGQVAGTADQASRLHDLLHAIEWQASGDSCEIDKEVKALFEKHPMLSNRQAPGNLPNGR